MDSLCDKLMITIDNQEKKIEEQHNEIINLLELKICESRIIKSLYKTL